MQLKCKFRGKRKDLLIYSFLISPFSHAFILQFTIKYRHNNFINIPYFRKLCLQSQTPKIFSAEHFTPYGVISANALLSIVKNYQVLGLDLKGLPPKYQESVSYIHILTASKQLSWANMTRLIRETPKNNFKVTSTATSVVFRSKLTILKDLDLIFIFVDSNMINNWINLFPKLTDARLQTGFLSEISLQFATNPTIKIFRCIAKNFEKAHLIIDSIKQRIPNLEVSHFKLHST